MKPSDNLIEVAKAMAPPRATEYEIQQLIISTLAWGYDEAIAIKKESISSKVS